MSCKAGKQHGEEFRYFASGKLEKRTLFKDGREQGRFEHFHRDGTLFSSGEYVDGELRLLSYFWTPDGVEERRHRSPEVRKEKTTYWKDGRPFTGVWKR
ncbi:toxin-antitoxin system YwqK family antitoxin [Hyalangium gracile]|uniref:toxin-antitoxin system YwqK family antitoxin n=1 Tax=Hyalangium gracile TaxID=394092 RepID=UPI001CCA4AC8|nr:hypothetical protein [Hyalangium gracile]